MLEPNALLWDQGSQKYVLWCSSPASGAHASRSNTIDGVSMPYCMWRSWARFHLSSGGIVCGDDVATNKGSLPLLPRAGRVVVWPTWSKYKTRKNLQIQTNTKRQERRLANQRADEIWNFYRAYPWCARGSGKRNTQKYSILYPWNSIWISRFITEGVGFQQNLTVTKMLKYFCIMGKKYIYFQAVNIFPRNLGFP